MEKSQQKMLIFLQEAQILIKSLSWRLGQLEAKMRSMNESIREVESKKRTLEELVDSLNEEITQLKATKQMLKVRISATEPAW